jgi:UDP-glucose 4-epimerase
MSSSVDTNLEWKGLPVLVTGGLGFVGSALVRELCAAGASVTVLDNLSRGCCENVGGCDVTVVEGDIRDADVVAQCVRDAAPVIVYHLAAMHFLPDCNRNPVGCIENNAIGTENVLSACRAETVTCFLMPTSMAVYPIMDEAVCETDLVGPYDIYGETKVMNEMQMQRWVRATQKQAVAVRLANVYGPRETNPHVIPAIMEQLAESGSAVSLGTITTFRDYIHSEDSATAFMAMASQGVKGDLEIFNLGTGTEHSIQQLLDMLSEILGRALDVRTDPARVRRIERMHLKPDMMKLRQATGWQPRVGMKEGLQRLCVDYGLE